MYGQFIYFHINLMIQSDSQINKSSLEFKRLKNLFKIDNFILNN